MIRHLRRFLGAVAGPAVVELGEQIKAAGGPSREDLAEALVEHMLARPDLSALMLDKLRAKGYGQLAVLGALMHWTEDLDASSCRRATKVFKGTPWMEPEQVSMALRKEDEDDAT